MTLRYMCLASCKMLSNLDNRERDTMDQRIGSIDDVIATVTELVFGNIDWAEACTRLPAYDGVQAID